MRIKTEKQDYGYTKILSVLKTKPDILKLTLSDIKLSTKHLNSLYFAHIYALAILNHIAI